MQNEIEMSTPINNTDTNIQLKEETSYCAMAKGLGVTCGTREDLLISKLSDMEERDKKGVERLGNKNVAL